MFCNHPASDEETKNAALEKLHSKLEGFIKNIEKILEENGGEWLVGQEFTWADLYVSVALDQVTFNAVLVRFSNFGLNTERDERVPFGIISVTAKIRTHKSCRKGSATLA